MRSEANRNGTIAFLCGRIIINTPASTMISATTGLRMVSETPPPNLKFSGITFAAPRSGWSYSKTKRPEIQNQFTLDETLTVQHEKRLLPDAVFTQSVWSKFEKQALDLPALSRVRLAIPRTRISRRVCIEPD